MTGRLGVLLIAIGVIVLVLSLFSPADDDLIDIAGVGCIVVGAVANAIGSDSSAALKR